MQYLGISYDVKHVPALDQGFIPFGVWVEAYQKGAKMPIAIAVERNDGNVMQKINDGAARAMLMRQT